MTNKETKGYTKGSKDMFKAYMEQQRLYTQDTFKDPNEPLDKWIIRKAEEQILGARTSKP